MRSAQVVRAEACARVGAGVLAIVAIARQLAIQMYLGYSVVNFFSYFTNLANIIAAGVLISAGGRSLIGRRNRPPSDRARAASVVYMTVVGIVFGALLRDVDLGSLLPWVNFVLHLLMPCIVVADWLLLPPRRALGIRDLMLWLILPALYLMYTLLRGSRVGWYPYPFLNPNMVGGYRNVAVYAVGISITFVLVGWGVMTVGNRLRAYDR